MADLAQFVGYAITLAGLYALIGSTVGLIIGVTRTFHLAYGSIYTASAYVFYFTYTVSGWSVGVSAAAAMLAGGVLGVACELGVYYPLRRRGSPAFVEFLASLGIAIVLQNVVAVLFGNDPKLVVRVVRRNLDYAGFSTSVYEALMPLAALLVLPLLLLFVYRTRPGQAMLAFADSPDGARIVGINVPLTRVISFALGSALAAVPSVLTALATSVTPTMGLTAVFVGIAATIVGGIGRLEGAILGGTIIGLATGLGAWMIGAEWQTAIAFGVLFVTLILRPTGIFGTRLWKVQV